MIGKIVKVILDRKLGSVHPKYKDIFTVNKGCFSRAVFRCGNNKTKYGFIVRKL